MYLGRGIPSGEEGLIALNSLGCGASPAVQGHVSGHRPAAGVVLQGVPRAGDPRRARRRLHERPADRGPRQVRLVEERGDRLDDEAGADQVDVHLLIVGAVTELAATPPDRGGPPVFDADRPRFLDHRIGPPCPDQALLSVRDRFREERGRQRLERLDRRGGVTVGEEGTQPVDDATDLGLAEGRAVGRIDGAPGELVPPDLHGHDLRPLLLPDCGQPFDLARRICLPDVLGANRAGDDSHAECGQEGDLGPAEHAAADGGHVTLLGAWTNACDPWSCERPSAEATGGSDRTRRPAYARG